MTEPASGRRVAFFGNVANSQFRAASALRAEGIDAHLFVSTTDGPASRPENDDPSLAEGYPSWIHLGPWITPASVLAPWRAPITRELRAFDVIVASGPAPIFAQFARRPWCFFVTGGDLTVKPFPVEFRRWYDTWPHRAGELVGGLWQRRAARRADQVWMQPFAPMVEAADRLRVPVAHRSEGYFPMIIDTDSYRPGADVSPAARRFVAEAVGDAAFVVFHPSRLVMEASGSLVRTGQWKGNDVLIRGFAAFLAAADPGVRALLVLPDTPLSRDVVPARRLIEELAIADHVRWIRPPDGRIFDRDHMVALYERATVVADEFGVGWFGYVSLEGLAMAKPVLCNIDGAAMGRLYPDHPLVSVSVPASVATELAALATDEAARARLGAEGRAWVERYHCGDAAAAVYRSTITALAGAEPSEG